MGHCGSGNGNGSVWQCLRVCRDSCVRAWCSLDGGNASAEEQRDVFHGGAPVSRWAELYGRVAESEIERLAGRVVCREMAADLCTQGAFVIRG